MDYNGHGWTNDNPPALNAANLNDMDNELVYLDKNAKGTNKTIQTEYDEKIDALQSVISGNNVTEKIRTPFEMGRKETNGSISASTIICHGGWTYAEDQSTGSSGLPIYFDATKYKMAVLAFLNGTLILQSSWNTSSPFTVGANKTYDELYINIKDKNDNPNPDVMDVYATTYFNKTYNSVLATKTDISNTMDYVRQGDVATEKVSDENVALLSGIAAGNNVNCKSRSAFVMGRKELDGSVSPSDIICYNAYEYPTMRNSGDGFNIYFNDSIYEMSLMYFLNGSVVGQESFAQVSPKAFPSNKYYDAIYLNVRKKNQSTNPNLLDVYNSTYIDDIINNQMSVELEQLKTKAVNALGVDVSSYITKGNSKIKLPVLSGITYKVFYQNVVDGMLSAFVGCQGKNAEVRGHKEFVEWDENGSQTFDPLVIGTWTNIQKNEYVNRFVYLQRVSNSLSGSLKCLLIGDSMTEYGTYQKTANDLLSDLGLTINWLGTKTTGGLNNEGRAGWSAYRYTHRESGNAFFNPSTQKFDFSYYMSQQQYSDVDVVFLNLGTNDFFSDAGETVETITQAWRDIVESIQNYNSNIKIVIWLCPPASIHNGVAQVGTYINGHYKARNIICENFIGNSWGANNIYILPVNLVVDPENDFPVDANDYCTDVVHPIASGYTKIGQIVASMLAYFSL